MTVCNNIVYVVCFQAVSFPTSLSKPWLSFQHLSALWRACHPAQKNSKRASSWASAAWSPPGSHLRLETPGRLDFARYWTRRSLRNSQRSLSFCMHVFKSALLCAFFLRCWQRMLASTLSTHFHLSVFISLSYYSHVLSTSATFSTK